MWCFEIKRILPWIVSSVAWQIRLPGDDRTLLFLLLFFVFTFCNLKKSEHIKLALQRSLLRRSILEWTSSVFNLSTLNKKAWKLPFLQERTCTNILVPSPQKIYQRCISCNLNQFKYYLKCFVYIWHNTRPLQEVILDFRSTI